MDYNERQALQGVFKRPKAAKQKTNDCALHTLRRSKKYVPHFCAQATEGSRGKQHPKGVCESLERSRGKE